MTSARETTPTLIGPAVINDLRHKSQHEVDVVALDLGGRMHDDKAPIAVLGEAKSTNHQRTLSDLKRLEDIRELLVHSGRNRRREPCAVQPHRVDEHLVKAAADRKDVHLITLEDMYTR
jgi:hypothetical protein